MLTADGLGKSVFYTAPDGLRLHLRDYDPGEPGRTPAICLCGLTRNGDDFAPLARALASNPGTARRVIVFDYRGRGASAYDPDWRHYDLATERGDILTGLALLGIEKAHVIGTSRGGLHVLAGAHAHAAKAPQREGEDQAEQEDSDGVIPIEQFERPLLFTSELLGVGPRPPAQHGDHAERDGDGQTLHGEHGPDYSRLHGQRDGKSWPRGVRRGDIPAIGGPV